MPCATHTSRMGWRAYKTFPTSSLPSRETLLSFSGLCGQVGWSLGHNSDQLVLKERYIDIKLYKIKDNIK